MYVVICPACRSAAFNYSGETTVGVAISLSNITGAVWKDSSIPSCCQCRYAFGPVDFKRDVFIDRNTFHKKNPYEALPSLVAGKQPTQLPDNPLVALSSIPTSPAGVSKRVWDHFREMLKKHAK